MDTEIQDVTQRIKSALDDENLVDLKYAYKNGMTVLPGWDFGSEQEENLYAILKGMHSVPLFKIYLDAESQNDYLRMADYKYFWKDGCFDESFSTLMAIMTASKTVITDRSLSFIIGFIHPEIYHIAGTPDLVRNITGSTIESHWQTFYSVTRYYVSLKFSSEVNYLPLEICGKLSRYEFLSRDSEGRYL